MQNLLIYAAAYLLGSLPCGLILARVFAGVNIKAAGSKSTGATNVLRVVKERDPRLAKKLALATALADLAKVALPLLVLTLLNFDPNILWTVGVLGVVGHCFSIFMGFDGGKGVASGAGAMVVLLPLPLLAGLAAWVVVGKIFKISSLASLAALAVFLIAAFSLYPELPGIHSHAPLILIVLLILYKHLPNIKRLIFKKEERIA